MAKYDPLDDYLAAKYSDTEDLTLTFQQIEKILAADLPASAHNYREWWANERVGSHIQAKAWMEAGWKVEEVNQQDLWVHFRHSS